jgi:hypothetical protein
MKQLNNLIIITLCITVLGFFANWAQNDYGMKLIGYCMLICSLLLFTKAFFHIQNSNAIKALYLLAMVCFTFLTVFNSYNLPDIIFVIIAIIALFFPILIIPICIKIIERSKEDKTPLFDYTFHVFLAMFCLGNYFKIYHFKGAGHLMATSGLIIFPTFFHAIIALKNGFKQKSVNSFIEAFIYLFVALDIVAFVFVTQHWPYGKVLIYISFVFAWLAIFSFLSGKFKKEIFLNRWKDLTWISKTAYFCFIIISAYYFLSRNNMAPKIYSNSLPPSLDEIFAKSNDITSEGKKFTKRKEIYIENYENFIDHRREAEEKSNGNLDN